MNQFVTFRERVYRALIPIEQLSMIDVIPTVKRHGILQEFIENTQKLTKFHVISLNYTKCQQKVSHIQIRITSAIFGVD